MFHGSKVVRSCTTRQHKFCMGQGSKGSLYTPLTSTPTSTRPNPIAPWVQAFPWRPCVARLKIAFQTLLMNFAFPISFSFSPDKLISKTLKYFSFHQKCSICPTNTGLPWRVVVASVPRPSQFVSPYVLGSNVDGRVNPEGNPL